MPPNADNASKCGCFSVDGVDLVPIRIRLQIEPIVSHIIFTSGWSNKCRRVGYGFRSNSLFLMDV